MFTAPGSFFSLGTESFFMQHSTQKPNGSWWKRVCNRKMEHSTSQWVLLRFRLRNRTSDSFLRPSTSWRKRKKRFSHDNGGCNASRGVGRSDTWRLPSQRLFSSISASWCLFLFFRFECFARLLSSGKALFDREMCESPANRLLHFRWLITSAPRNERRVNKKRR